VNFERLIVQFSPESRERLSFSLDIHVPQLLASSGVAMVLGYTVGDYRIIYTIDDGVQVIVVTPLATAERFISNRTS
jgi:mRNA-degrading endonuclease RelE of RelBE toxin-antitoxin system